MINQFAVHEHSILFLKANSHFAALNLLLSERKKLKKVNVSLSYQYL